MTPAPIGWLGILRLGLVQASLGSIVVLTTSTLNRVIVVELGLAALVPGVLVAIHYLVQTSRPRFGHGSDQGRRRTPWIIGGLAVLAAGGVLAAIATALMAESVIAGTALAIVAFTMIGLGVGASGTCLLVLLSSLVAPERRAAAASITWIMMIAGFALTAGVAGAFLDPFSMTRLITVTAIASALALCVATLSLRGLEPADASKVDTSEDEQDSAPSIRFIDALRDVLSERHTRRFAIFVFISMLAYSAQDLVLEPFAGAVFDLTPGQSTQLGGLQHGGVLVGMLMFAAIGYRLGQRSMIASRACMLGGCIGSAVLLSTLSFAALSPDGFPLAKAVFVLGVANGVFAVAAISAMMGLVSEGHAERDGVRMGVWGAAQALAFGTGGVVGTLIVDVVRLTMDSTVLAYSIVFMLQAVLFGCAAWLAAVLSKRRIVAKPPTRTFEHVY